MSLIPYVFGDPFVDPYFDFSRPSRILNQHFGVELDPEDMLAPFTIPQDLRQFLRNPAGYFRPWSTSAAQNDSGSTVTMDKDKFEINLDVQQFEPNEITVKTTGDNVITVEGKHEEKENENGYVSRQFVRKYFLPRGHDIKNVASNLSSDGILTITAPRTDSEAIESRNVPIEHTGKPIKEAKNKSFLQKLKEKIMH